MADDTAVEGLLGDELGRLAEAAETTSERTRDLSGTLKALARRAATENLPPAPIARMLRQHADFLAERMREMHELARKLEVGKRGRNGGGRRW